MARYTLSTPNSFTTFAASDDTEAAQIADQLTITFLAPKSACTLKRIPSSICTQKMVTPNPWRLITPQGPSVAIPILINDKWFTPNGGRIFDINSYKTRMINNHLSKTK